MQKRSKGKFLKKTLEDFEAEAVWKDGCLLHTSAGTSRRLYQMRHGPLNSNIFVCHTCDNPHCILDAHHFPGTAKDNTQDMVRKGRQNFSEEVRLKMSLPKKGCVFTAAHKEKLLKKSIGNLRALGHTVSKEAREKIRVSAKQQPPHKRSAETREKQRQIAFRREASTPKEIKSARAKKRWEGISREECSERVRKSWATRKILEGAKIK